MQRKKIKISGQKLIGMLSWMEGTIRLLMERIRWSMFEHHGEQTVIDHQWSLAMLIYAVANLENQLRKKALFSSTEILELVMRALVHDVGEADIPDVPYPIRHDARLQRVIPATELTVGLRRVARLFPWTDNLTELYGRVHSSNNKKLDAFFMAMEEVEYFLYGFVQYFEYGRPDIIIVVARGHQVISELRKEYRALAKMFPDELMQNVAAELESKAKLIMSLRAEDTTPSNGVVIRVLLQLEAACKRVRVPIPPELRNALEAMHLLTR